MRTLIVVSAATLASCSTARLVGPPIASIPDSGAAHVVVVEPFFESTEWKVTTQAEHARVYGGYPGYGPYGGYYNPSYDTMPRDVTVYRDVAQKPVFARLPVLTQEQRGVINGVQRLRPKWRVASTGEILKTTGPVTLVRVIIGEPEIVGSNRAFKNLTTGFGIIIPPLLLFNIKPVDETQRVYGALVRFDADAADLRPRLMRYQTQPDYAVDTRGLNFQQQPFGLDLQYEEGVLASESSREPVLVSGFVQRLAVAVVALVEGVK